MGWYFCLHTVIAVIMVERTFRFFYHLHSFNPFKHYLRCFNLVQISLCLLLAKCHTCTASAFDISHHSNHKQILPTKYCLEICIKMAHLIQSAQLPHVLGGKHIFLIMLKHLNGSASYLSDG